MPSVPTTHYRVSSQLAKLLSVPPREEMNTTSASVQEPNPTIIFDTLNAFQRSAALKASIELDLFTAMARAIASRRPLRKLWTLPPAASAYFAITS